MDDGTCQFALIAIGPSNSHPPSPPIFLHVFKIGVAQLQNITSELTNFCAFIGFLICIRSNANVIVYIPYARSSESADC